MKKVSIAPGCITCGKCEFISPETFQVTDVARVVANADTIKNQAAIQEAIDACPVQVIYWANSEKQ